MSTATARLAESAAPLDVLLVDAALGPLHRFLPDMSTAKWAVSLARRPDITARRLGELGAEAGRILTGTSTVAPHRGDRRFTDVAWTENPLLKRLVQLYLAGRHTAEQLVIDADLDPRDRERVRFFLENVAEAVAPSNVPLVNPVSTKAVDRHRGVEPGPRGQAAGEGPGLGPSRAGDGRRQRLRPGREHRRDAGCGRLPHRGAGADPVRAPDRRGLRGAGAGGPAHDQQVLRARPRPGAQPRRVRRPAGQADVRHLLAQPGLAARHLEPRHLRPCRPRRPGGRGGDHGQRADGARVECAPAASSRA